ncbi:MAG TPA: glycosyltransferase family 2 protein [Candidatus Acidoferrum sp.]|nr:glycosyltransferase family 2 protein [Candidatus Acidoferrum sp.]
MITLILVPAFNEAATIAGVVTGALAHAPVIVVDDGSIDATAALARAAGAEVIRHPRRQGKGQAIRTGLAVAAARGATAVVTLDGDGQHDPADIPRLRAAAAALPGALVIGGRLGESGGFGRGRLNAVRVAGFFVNWVTGLHVEDTQSGFRLYPLPLVRDLPTRHGGFVFETEVLIAAARRGVMVCEVPVRTSPRTAQRSRFRPLVDGVRIGAYLTGRGIGRWLVETRETLVSVRGTGFAEWWRHPRRRRAAAAASGTALSPLLLGLAIGQAVVGAIASRLATRPDFVTPVVTRWFSQDRLTDLGGLAAGPPKPPDHAVELRDTDVVRGRRGAGASSFATTPGVPS